MKTLGKSTASVAFLIALLAAGATTARAQDRRVIADVPFDFAVQGLLMPAGDYVITDRSEGILSIESKDGRYFAFVLSTASDAKTLRPELRMNAYATSGGVAKKKFEAYALAASIVGKCHFCVKSHFDLLKKEGLTTQQLRDIGRIAAVVNAAAQVLAAE